MEGDTSYFVDPNLKGADSVLEHILGDNPDFGDLDVLHGQKSLAAFQCQIFKKI